MLRLPATQDDYDAWLGAKWARANDPADEYMAADVMDCNNALAFTLSLWDDYPEARRTLSRFAPTIIERAGTELGTFMSAAALGRLVGLEPKDSHARMSAIIRNAA